MVRPHEQPPLHHGNFSKGCHHGRTQGSAYKMVVLIVLAPVNSAVAVRRRLQTCAPLTGVFRCDLRPCIAQWMRSPGGVRLGLQAPVSFFPLHTAALCNHYPMEHPTDHTLCR